MNVKNLNPWLGIQIKGEEGGSALGEPGKVHQANDGLNQRLMESMQIVSGLKGDRAEHAVRFKDIEGILSSFGGALQSAAGAGRDSDSSNDLLGSVLNASAEGDAERVAAQIAQQVRVDLEESAQGFAKEFGIEAVNEFPTAGMRENQIVMKLPEMMLYRWDGSQWTTQLFAGVAPGAVNIASFANGIRPIEIVDELPSTGNFKGRSVLLTTDDKIYRHTGSPAGSAGFTSAVPSVDVTGQLTDSQIAAVAAAKLTGQITQTQITDGAISTSKLAAAAVVANNIATSAIVADKIAANAVTTAKINTGAVTANEIATNAVTAAKIAADAVTAGKVAAGAINAREIAAGAVTTEKLVVADFANRVSDPNGLDLTHWKANSPAANLRLWAGTGATDQMTSGIAIDTLAGTWSEFQNQVVGTYSAPLNTNRNIGFEVTPGETYHIKAKVHKSVGSTPVDAYLGLRVTNGNTNNSSYPRITVSYAANESGWRDIEGIITIPATVNALPSSLAVVHGGVGSSATLSGIRVLFGAMQIRRAASGELIVDGAITADKIAANAITGDKITANAIGANQIAANAVTAAKIAAGAVTAGKIAANAVTANEINVSTLSAITANLGTVTAGVIQSPNYAAGSAGARINLSNGSAEFNNVVLSRSLVLASGSFTVSSGTSFDWVNTGIRIGDNDVWSTQRTALVAVARFTPTGASGTPGEGALWGATAQVYQGFKWFGRTSWTSAHFPTRPWTVDPSTLVTPSWSTGTTQRVLLNIDIQASAISLIYPLTIFWRVFQVT